MNLHQSRRSRSGPPVPADIISGLKMLATGERTFAAFRDDLANTLYLNFRVAEPIGQYLSSLESAGHIPTHLTNVLRQDIQRICSEDVPTLVDTTSADVGDTDAGKGRGDTRARKTSERPAVVAVATKKRQPAVANLKPLPDKGPDTNESAGQSASLAGIDERREDIASTRRQRIPEINDVLADRYELLERVAGGSMSVVYRARDMESVRPDGTCAEVAVKLLSDELATHDKALRALQHEAEQGLRFEHPNIVRFHSFEHDENRFFIVMEWLPGEALSVALNRKPGETWPYSDAMRVIRAIGAALGCVHAAGLAHADVKPGNIMLLPDGEVKLLDFGVARAFGELRKQEADFDPSVLGAATPAYSSPDVLAGSPTGPVDDVYSLACVAYRLLSGTRAFGARSGLEAREKNMLPPRPENLSDSQWLALRSGLAHFRTERPATVREFVSQLTTRTTWGGPAGVSMPSSGRRTVVFLVCAMIFAAALALDLISLPGLGKLDATPALSPPGVPDGESASRAGPTTGTVPAELDSPPVARPVDLPETALIDAEPLPAAPDAVGIAANGEYLPDSFSFSAPEIVVDEHGGALSLVVHRYNPTTGTVAVPYLISPGTASEDDDYIAPLDRTVRFRPGETESRVFIPLVDDGVIEEPEYLELMLLTDTEDLRLVTTTVITVIDNDGWR